MIANGANNIEKAHGVKIVYFSQNLNILNPALSILQNAMETSVYNERDVRTILTRLLFRREDVHKKVEVLSGGERVKAAFAKVFLSDSRVLINYG
jgi:macrolide transport system ATP-binding/permease protein